MAEMVRVKRRPTKQQTTRARRKTKVDLQQLDRAQVLNHQLLRLIAQ